MGVIKEIRSEDCSISILKADGTYTIAPIADRYNVTLTVEAPVRVDERGHYYVNRTNILAVGWGLDLYTKTSLFGGTVLEIK